MKSLAYPVLTDLGLNDNEALIYELLLQYGPQGGAELTEKSGVGRGNVYNTLTSLKMKNLVEEETGTKTIYKPSDPEQLRRLAKIRQASAEAVSEQITAILPSLKSSYRLMTVQPTVRVFEGVEGLKDIYRETLRDGQTIYAYVSPDEPDARIYRWLTTTYVQERVKHDVHVKVVVNGSSQTAEYLAKNQAELREARFVKNDLYPFRGEIDVFGDKVAFISYKSEELFGVIVESASIAETLRSSVKLILDLLSSKLPQP